MYGVILAILLLVSIMLIVSVLLQAGTGGGLAAMGGGASTDSFLGGRQATTILTKATWWLGGTFLFLSMVLAGMNTRTSTPRSVLEGATPTLPAPVAPPPGAASGIGDRGADARCGDRTGFWELVSGDQQPAYVLLEDGAWFSGTTRHLFGVTPGEVVFTTNLSGYQEVFTDPSYLGQVVVMTAPMIGNYGINPEDLESEKPQVNGVVVRELSQHYSNWRATGSLGDWLAQQNIPVVEGVDTRRLARHIRSDGAMRGVVAVGDEPSDDVRAQLEESPSMEGLDLASVATRTNEREVGAADAARHVVAFDFGMKENILRLLMEHGCRITVVPANTSAGRVRELGPQGVFLSNGPGDPGAVTYAPPVIRELAETGLPIFGICLGHQLLSLAFGGTTDKLPYGHRGGNHPVRHMQSGRVLITSQNHGFAVRGKSKVVSGAKELEVTHRNLNDDTVEGVRHRELPVFGVQYHPEASPGPHDARPHFAEFVQALDSQ